MSVRLELDAHEVHVPNPDKPMFAKGYTKSAMVGYHVRAAPRMLPHMRGRALSLVRHPDGADRPGFYQKTPGGHYPEWLQQVALPRRTKPGVRHYTVVDDAAGLAYLAGQAVIEFHGWTSLAANPRAPERMVVDLDPPPASETEPDAAWGLVVDAARMLLRLAEILRFKPYLMTTGSRGLHVVVPLAPGADFDAVRRLSDTLARTLVRAAPTRFTMHLAKDRRKGRLFLDTLRNVYGATSVSPYSLRARAGAPVAAPTEHALLDDPDARADHYTLADVAWLMERPDPWKDFEQDRVDVHKVLARCTEAGL